MKWDGEGLSRCGRSDGTVVCELPSGKCVGGQTGVVYAVFTPNVSLSFVALTAFAFLSSFVLLPGGRSFPGIDWVRSKPWLALAGVASPALAILASFGLLLQLRTEFNAIATVMPFLVVC